MKRLLSLNSALLLVLIFAISSCVSDLEEAQEPVVSEAELLVEEESEGGENLRRGVFGKNRSRFYFERFQNTLSVIPGDGFNPETLENAFVPGTGKGRATFMGNATTFLNQFTQLGPEGLGTIGKPVTQFYGQQLAELGITNVPDEVSSITADAKGNSVWFKNLGNKITPVSETRFNFEADVEVIGGTGRFENATGKGKVRGFFNPMTQEGSSIIFGRIKF